MMPSIRLFSIRLAYLILLLAIYLLPSMLFAQEADDDVNDDYSTISNIRLEEDQELARSAVSERYHQEIKTILSGQDFAQKETITRWRFIKNSEEASKNEKIPSWLISFIEFLEEIGFFDEDSNDGGGTLQNFFQFLEILLWCLAIGLIAWVLIRHRNSLITLVQNFGGRTEETLPTSMFGLDVTKESLPEDVLGEAKSLWNQQSKRAAIGLLLRSSLINLLHDHDVRLADSHTETECCEYIEQQTPATVSEFMYGLVKHWQLVAYAHRNPTDSDFENLCQQWQRVF